jgi:hypothetical protein
MLEDIYENAFVCKNTLVRYLAIDYVVGLPRRQMEDKMQPWIRVNNQTAVIASSYINLVFR